MNNLMKIGKWLWFCGFMLEAVLLAWQWYGLGVDKRDASELPDPLPAMSKPLDLPAMVSDIIKKNIWELERKAAKAEPSASVASAADKAVVKWHLRALGGSKGGLQFAVIGVAGESAVKYYHVGDQLPDGAKLLKILIDGIKFSNGNGVKNGDGTKTVYMFGRE